jgi:hypothetical protein
MRLRALRWGLRFLLLAIAVAVAASFVVMTLWNWLVPAVFAGPAITLAQAGGLLLLSRILVGSLRGRGGMHWRGRLEERLARMSPEERERFRAGMRGGRCGRGEPGVEQAQSPGAPA